MVLLDLKAILTLVCLNRLVILRMCVWGGKCEGCPLWAVFIACGGFGARYSVLYLVF